MDPSSTNAFAILDLPLHPILEEATITRAYDLQTRAGLVDREVLNHARAILSSPAKRLRHFLALNGQERFSDQIPLNEDMLGIFSQASNILEVSARLSRRKKQNTTALADAILTRQVMQVRDELSTLQTALRHIEAEKLDALAGLCQPASLIDLPPALAAQLSELQGTFTFLEKWREQLQKAWAELY